MAKRNNTPTKQTPALVATVPLGQALAAGANMAAGGPALVPVPTLVPAPVPALASMAAQLAAAPVAVQPAAPAAAPAVAPTVALRGGLAIAAVALTGKPYRVAAAHNAAWWAQVQALVAAGNGTASVQALVAAGVPAIMVGYLVRRGYCAAAPAPAAAPAAQG